MGPTGWRRLEPLDLVVAAALTLATQVEIWAPDLLPATEAVRGSHGWLAVTSLGMTVPLAVRRTVPLAGGLLPLFAAALQDLVTAPTEGVSTLVALMLAVYSVAAHGTGREAAAGGAATVLASSVMGVDVSDHVFILVVLGAAWVMGLVVGRTTRVSRRLEADKEQLEAQRAAAAAAGAEAERVRIARDLHDVVAHRVSMMVVQAQAADALLPAGADDARAALRSVEEAGRQAMAELRSMLGVLRGDDAASRAPQAGLDDVDRLVEAARGAGLDVTLRVEGEPRPVPAAVGIAAYRVVQESVTNLLKHAPRAAAVVRIGYGEHLRITVTDDGPSADGTGEGFGLAGMRERVEFVGGTLRHGAREAGGFEVYAVLPLEEAPA